MIKATDFKNIQAQLSEEFSADEIDWRITSTGNFNNVDKGLAVPYVDSRAIQNRLDSVFGPFGWRNEFRAWHTEISKEGSPTNSQLCGISVLVEHENGESEWITKWDGSENTDNEEIKGGLSKSQIRAAVQWGIGRYIYTIPSVWVEVEKKGKSTVIKPSERPKLINALTRVSNQASTQTPNNTQTANKTTTAKTGEQNGSLSNGASVNTSTQVSDKNQKAPEQKAQTKNAEGNITPAQVNYLKILCKQIAAKFKKETVAVEKHYKTKYNINEFTEVKETSVQSLINDLKGQLSTDAA